MSDTPLETLTIDVEYSTEDEDFGPVYIATNDAIGLVTHGHTFEELRSNLTEAIAACLEDVDTVSEYGLVANPRVELRMSFPYGETA